MDSRTCITILVDNTASKPNFLAEHGLSLWVEHNGKYILFDTGQSNMFIQNAQSLGINLAKADAIIVSHGHYDHTGGLKAILDIVPKATLYLHPEALKLRYSQNEKTARMIGMSNSAKEAVRKMTDTGGVVWTEMPTEIFPGLFATSKIPRNTNYEDTGGPFFVDNTCQKADEFPDDQAVFFKMKQGLVVLLGCAHAGVVNTLNYVIKMTNQKNVYAIAGGMHLVNANLTRIENTIEAFKKYDIQKIVPLHCTGQKAAEKIKNAFGEKCLPSGAGAKIFF